MYTYIHIYVYTYIHPAHPGGLAPWAQGLSEMLRRVEMGTLPASPDVLRALRSKSAKPKTPGRPRLLRGGRLACASLRGNHLSNTIFLSNTGVLQKRRIIPQIQLAVLDKTCLRKQVRPHSTSSARQVVPPNSPCITAGSPPTIHIHMLYDRLCYAMLMSFVC